MTFLNVYTYIYPKIVSFRDDRQRWRRRRRSPVVVVCPFKSNACMQVIMARIQFSWEIVGRFYKYPSIYTAIIVIGVICSKCNPRAIPPSMLHPRPQLSHCLYSALHISEQCSLPLNICNYLLGMTMSSTCIQKIGAI